MKKIVVSSIIIVLFLFGAATYLLWYANALFLRVRPEVVLVNGVESNDYRVYKSANSDYLVFVESENGIRRTFVIYESSGMVAVASRLNWSFELPWFFFAPDTVTGSVVAGQFKAKLSGGLAHVSSEQLAFRVEDIFVDVDF
jgi:hypothetical protein